MPTLKMFEKIPLFKQNFFNFIKYNTLFSLLVKINGKQPEKEMFLINAQVFNRIFTVQNCYCIRKTFFFYVPFKIISAHMRQANQ